MVIEKLSEVRIDEPFDREVPNSWSMLILYEKVISDSLVVRTWVCVATDLPVCVSEGPK